MSEILVACFSATGTTAELGERLAKVAGADFFRITPAEEYTAEDLDWTDASSRTTKEMRNSRSRPALVWDGDPTEGHSMIFLGFPIWWYIAPTLINTFLEDCNLSGKRIVLFATSGGSGFGKTLEALKGSIPTDAELLEGDVFNHPVTDEELAGWAARFQKNGRA